MSCAPTSSKPGVGRPPQGERSKQSSGRKRFASSGKRRKEVIDALREQNKVSYQPAPGSELHFALFS